MLDPSQLEGKRHRGQQGSAGKIEASLASARVISQMRVHMNAQNLYVFATKFC